MRPPEFGMSKANHDMLEGSQVVRQSVSWGLRTCDSPVDFQMVVNDTV